MSIFVCDGCGEPTPARFKRKTDDGDVFNRTLTLTSNSSWRQSGPHREGECPHEPPAASLPSFPIIQRVPRAQIWDLRQNAAFGVFVERIDQVGALEIPLLAERSGTEASVQVLSRLLILEFNEDWKNDNPLNSVIKGSIQDDNYHHNKRNFPSEWHDSTAFLLGQLLMGTAFAGGKIPCSLKPKKLKAIAREEPKQKGRAKSTALPFL